MPLRKGPNLMSLDLLYQAIPSCHLNVDTPLHLGIGN